ncbi:hypothetical protein QGX11_gp133 [Pseudomonas phage PPSC2]|uniref:VWFA domain-containing protein n=1 Tax=Pseudomonas phage PPSC2 TaxID=2041350 RepID=A0A2R2YAV2_9CAUD|nr:hypothetical protein QGX11_gp133 [Pseudomonas phage PPSC2]ATN92896.1 hypothetical protein PPSC2_133 [Pseudomonas phage PPSC2]
MSTLLLDLTKSLELNLEKAQILNVPAMAVKLLVDKSGSMSYEFANGWVQNTIDLFLVAAMKFDDDGVLQIGFFNTQFEETPEVTAADVGTYVRRNGISAGGGTAFADGLEAFKGGKQVAKKGGLFGRLFGGSSATSTEKATPVYIALITDGENGDKRAFEAQLASLDNTFVQIVGIGSGVDKRYLDGVAKQYKNVSVIYLPDPKAVTPDSFYEALLNEDLKNFIK